MNANQLPALALFAIALAGLGVLAIVYGDFAMVWQPVPAWFPMYKPLAYAVGLLMLALSVGLIVPRWSALSVRVMLVYFALWAVLKVPDVLNKPAVEGSWGGLGELTMLLAGGWILAARLGRLDQTPIALLTGDRAIRAAQILFALSIIPIGIEHFVYLDGAKDLVPHWLPARRAWTQITGAGQIASGLGIFFNVLPRIAAWAEAAQVAIYTLLIWVPAAVMSPHLRLNWTALAISSIFGAAAFAVAQNVSAARPFSILGNQPSSKI